ncbi:toll/interleukin-1 receptor domain-containing protein [Chryseobacterium sp. cx-311]|uniref:toll/interleukin-1 receptor domain-containing protein n=1 Tax=Marnyiella aurantia TaxID=2758037 RepID=UPI001AE82083|nr:toll/interleukin-1 receptor domain-containing protein [Marnyiella aurantia]MBP0613941.1 toll/interleukin-1 receptor domain-containing protein [Marnyiella aurantia]
MKAFISYSHKDQNYLERLKIHLAQMRREGLISEWTDEEIHAGSNLDDVISTALSSSELFLALLTPDYIASNYCYNKEFKEAQKMQDEGKLIIVPVIIEPCEWQQTPFGNLKALPKDGKAVSDWTNPNNAFLNVIDELRRLTTFSKSSIGIENISPAAVEKLVRNYKVKKNFSEVDNYNFKERSYEQIKNYFQSSISELDAVENLQARFINDGKGFFTALISNRANNLNSFLTIQIGNDGLRHFGDLSYSFSEQVTTNSIQMNKVYKIENDEYEQFWTKNSQGFGFSNQANTRLTALQVAEGIWDDFISQVGVSLD